MRIKNDYPILTVGYQKFEVNEHKINRKKSHIHKSSFAWIRPIWVDNIISKISYQSLW